MHINKILKEFVKECSEKLKLKGIVQFGSSTYSKDFHDVDLVFYFKEDIISAEKSLELIRIMKDFEGKYEEVVFDFSAPVRRRRGNYFITVVPVGRKDLDVMYNPLDLFFYKNLAEDKHKKILFGEDSLKEAEIKLTNQHLFEMLSINVIKSLERSLDDKKYKLESSYFLFKTFLRAMLINEGILKKENLLSRFRKNYKIKLPRNSDKIIKNELSEKDFRDILKFTEDCLKYLVK